MQQFTVYFTVKLSYDGDNIRKAKEQSVLDSAKIMSEILEMDSVEDVTLRRKVLEK